MLMIDWLMERARRAGKHFKKLLFTNRINIENESDEQMLDVFIFQI